MVICEITNPLVRKLVAFAPLTDDDCRVLNELTSSARQVASGIDLIAEGENPSVVHLVLEGFVCRYKILPDGRRQIMAYLVPGDFCDMHVFVLKEMDHGLATLSTCSIVEIDRANILQLLERPAIARAFWVATLVDEATLREWLANLGQRNASRRTAHLLCELLFRLKAVDLVDKNHYELPLTQTDLADTVGVSVVHINRILRQLRQGGLITMSKQHLIVHDVGKLIEFSGFNPNYLHLDERDGGTSFIR